MPPCAATRTSWRGRTTDRDEESYSPCLQPPSVVCCSGVMKIVHRALVAVVALLAVASLSSCAPGAAKTGAITVRTTDTTASETLTVSVVDLSGHTVRQATGPGTSWSATFTDVPAGRYRVRLLIAQPVAPGPDGATSESVLT